MIRLGRFALLVQALESVDFSGDGMQDLIVGLTDAETLVTTGSYPRSRA